MKISEPFGDFFNAATAHSLFDISKQDIDEFAKDNYKLGLPADNCIWRFINQISKKSIKLFRDAYNAGDQDAAKKAQKIMETWIALHDYPLHGTDNQIRAALGVLGTTTDELMKLDNFALTGEKPEEEHSPSENLESDELNAKV